MRALGWEASIILIILMVVLGALLMSGGGLSVTAPTLASGAGQIYVAEIGRVLRVNDVMGSGSTTVGTPGALVNQFGKLIGIFVDETGGIYVADVDNSRIVRLNDMTGRSWTALGAPLHPEQLNKPLISFGRPVGVFADRSGRIYVPDAGNNRIVRMDDMTGAGWTTFGTGGTGVNSFNHPDAIFVDGAGRIYVSDWGNSRIVRVNDMTGAGWLTLGTEGTGISQFKGPTGIGLDGAGRIYVADWGNGRIVRVNDMTGAGWTTFGTFGHGVNQFGGMACASGIFVDEVGRIYVADWDRIVRVNDMTGAGWRTLNTPGFALAIFVR